MITSKEHNGEIHKRTKENIKKKIWNMIRKWRSEHLWSEHDDGQNWSYIETLGI
jgi:hypothetical protein